MLSTVHQWFPCGPLSARHLTWFLPGLFLLCSRPWLLTNAAGGDLKPAPVSRFRGAYPHQLCSYALQQPVPLSLCSWHTVVRVADDYHFGGTIIPSSFPPSWLNQYISSCSCESTKNPKD